LLYARVFPVLALNEVKTILRTTGESQLKQLRAGEHITVAEGSKH
jgi:hypothetical protein